MLFSFQNITHSFDEKPLFEDIGYTMLPGGLLIIKGANGCGKTTLLKILAGLITPKSGFVFYDFSADSSLRTNKTQRVVMSEAISGDKNALSLLWDCFARSNSLAMTDTVKEISEDYKSYFKHIHYLGHNNAVDPLLTVRENLEFWAELNNLKEGIAPAIKFFKLENVLDTECKKLSAGWNRRIALARLMLRKSSLWILDEPFANLDEEVIDFTLKMIASFCDQGGMVILSCHQEVNLPFGAEMRLR